MSRQITDVHEQIVKEIPASETELLNDLNNFINEQWNKAPEVLCGPEVYKPYTNILSKHVGDFNAGWKIKVRDIFNGTVN